MANKRLVPTCSQVRHVLSPTAFIGSQALPTPRDSSPHNPWSSRVPGGQRGFGLAAALRKPHQPHRNGPGSRQPKPQKRNSLYEADATRASRVQEKRRAFDDESQANPFYRILTSPLRKCQITRRTMPRDMLVCVKPVFVPEVDAASPGPTRVSALTGLPELFLPDYIYHPAFQPKKPGKSSYFCADKRVLEELVSRKGGTLGIVSSTAQLPGNLEAMITFQLQQRVLQEILLLHATSRVRPDLLMPRSVQQASPDEGAGVSEDDSSAAYATPFEEQGEKFAALLDFTAPPAEVSPGAAGLPSLPLYFSMGTLLRRPASTPDLDAILPPQSDADAGGTADQTQDAYPERDDKGFLRLTRALQTSPLSEAHRLLAEVLRAAEAPYPHEGDPRRTESTPRDGGGLGLPELPQHLYIPLIPAFGPLGVALWRLEKWEGSGRLEGGSEAGGAEGRGG